MLSSTFSKIELGMRLCSLFSANKRYFSEELENSLSLPVKWLFARSKSNKDGGLNIQGGIIPSNELFGNLKKKSKVEGKLELFGEALPQSSGI